MEDKKFKVHSIESFGTHDGPGIRMVVFLQGCNLKCLYCQNPDTITGKGGEVISMSELLERALKMKNYFSNGGGVTISGGEPLLQSEALIPLLEKLKAHDIHTNIDTNATIKNKYSEEIISNLADLVMFDMKGSEAAHFKNMTGVDRFKIALENIELREQSGKPFWIRYVLVPGYTNQQEHLHWLGKTFQSYQQLEKLEILPFHQMGIHKWEAINETYQLKNVEAPSKSELDNVKTILSQYFSDEVLCMKT